MNSSAALDRCYYAPGVLLHPDHSAVYFSFGDTPFYTAHLVALHMLVREMVCLGQLGPNNHLN